MSFDFTIALIPKELDLTQEMNYVKSALLYADQVTLISPMAYLFHQFTDEKNSLNEKNAIKLFYKILPLIKEKDPNTYNSFYPVLNELSKIVNGKQYNSLPYVKKIQIKSQLKSYSQDFSKLMFSFIGNENADDLDSLIRHGQVKIESFNNSIADVDRCVLEYYNKLKVALKSSYPLFDEQSNDLMKAALESNIINVSPTDKRKITHAGLADNYIQRLPSFSEATIDELIDIKSELSQPLIRFRSKMLCYSDSLQSMPWDNDFEKECDLLYDKEVAPALLEIEECTKDNSFIKNLGKKFFTDEGFWKSTGGLVLGIAAGGAISSFNDVISTEQGMLAAGGAFVASKIAGAYNEYRKTKKDIQRKDLYFYYKAGKELDNLPLC